MADDKGGYKELLSEIKELRKDVESQYKKLDAKIENYHAQLSDLRERFYDLRHEFRVQRYLEMPVGKKEKRIFSKMMPTGMYCRGNSASDPDYDLFTLDELPEF